MAAPAAREVVATANAPAAIGPYSQAIKAGGFVFCSGAIPFDVKKNALCTGSITEQTTVCFQNITAVCKHSILRSNFVDPDSCWQFPQ